MASGRPSSLRQISVTVSVLSAVTRNSGLVLRARSPNNSIASSASDSDGTRQLTSPATPIGSRLVVSNVSAGHPASRAVISSALASSRCSQLSSTISIWRSRMNRSSTSIVGWPGWSGRPSARAAVTGDHVGIGDRCQVDVPDPVGEVGGRHRAATCTARRVLPAPPAPVSVTSRLSASASRMPVDFRLAPDETRQLRRKMLGRNGIGGAQRRKVVVQVGVAELHHPFGAGQIAQRMGAEVDQRDVLRELVDDKRFRRTREHRLAAVGEVAQPRGAVDRRADVVAFVAQLDVAGVHADAQLDRCQRRPLQLQRAGHRVGGAGERDDEAVALALLDRSHTVVGGDRVGQRLVEARDRGLHRVGLGLPQARRTLDVGQQQRHRSGRKLAHASRRSSSFRSC